jgi:hypothetical protein
MNKLVYIYVPNEFVIGQVVFKLLSKRFAVATSKDGSWFTIEITLPCPILKTSDVASNLIKAVKTSDLCLKI